MDRESFLERISRRLGRRKPERPPTMQVSGILEAFRGPPQSFDKLASFQVELERVGGKVHVASTLAEAHLALQHELSDWGANSVCSWARSEFEGWQLDWLWSRGRAKPWLEEPLTTREGLLAALAEAQIGITSADFGIASTGTLVLSAAPARPRAMSLLPSVHIALLRASRLVYRLGETFPYYRSRPGGLPSAIHYITGPSRTSDIENDLTIGVHGPAAVVAIVWKDDG